MCKSTMRWAIALIPTVFFLPGLGLAQRSWETIPVYRGLEVRNGMLVFSSKEVFDQVYQDLEQRIQDWNASPDARSPEETTEDPCPDDNAVLSLFEQRYQINSIRKSTLLRECEWLDAGKDPVDFQDHFLVDELLASLFNEKYQLQVGTDIYYLPRDGITYIVANEDLATLAALERGESPYGKPNVTVHGPEEDCVADFSVNTNPSTTTVGFSFNGQPQAGIVNFFWEFGDGTVSVQPTPVHEYSAGGTYTVCLTIEAVSPISCIDRVCKEIQVGEQDGCFPFFIYNETGQPGGICFIDNTQILQNVISWLWQFGDGSEGATVPNPCHVFPCDKTFFVTLTIETSSGCISFFTMPVEVDSYGCCSASAKKKDFHYYSGNLKRIKYNQRHVQIPLLYYRVVSTMKNYKLNSNGKWRKEEANLRIDLLGEVFLASESGCKCNSPFGIAKTGMAMNKKSMTITKAVGKAFKAKKDFEWSAKYTVNNALLIQPSTPVICD